MSNIHQIDRQAQLKKAALAEQELQLDSASLWITKLDRGLTDSEKNELKQWLSAKPQHIEVLLEVARLWDKMDDLSRLADIFPQTAKKRQQNHWFGAIAATVMLAMAWVIYQTGYGVDAESLDSAVGVVAMQASYQTAVGQSSTIDLPDQSKIILNTNSFVQVRYSQKARIIELQRGEIHIDVAHDKSRPLSVVVAGKVIQAVGTAFNVEVDDQQVELIVTDGKVLVAMRSQSPSAESVNTLPPGSMAISKGEKVKLDDSGALGNEVVKLDPVEMAASLSWRQGKLIFRGESLAEAMVEIGRYTNIHFELADDEKLQQVQVAGMFKTGDINGLLEVLSSSFNITHQRIGNHKIILNYAK